MSDTNLLIPLDTLVPVQGKNFYSLMEGNPCTGCSAPCCRMVLIPHPAPTTYMDLDYILYMLGFSTIEMLLSPDGQWQVIVHDNCRFLDAATNLCTVHGTPRKPKTCVFFNPHQCWYKRNFHSEQNFHSECNLHNVTLSDEVVRINLEAMETILQHVSCDEAGNIIEVPTWEAIRDLVAGLHLSNEGQQVVEEIPQDMESWMP